jgi:hypothetical protein
MFKKTTSAFSLEDFYLFDKHALIIIMSMFDTFSVLSSGTIDSTTPLGKSIVSHVTMLKMNMKNII